MTTAGPPRMPAVSSPRRVLLRERLPVLVAGIGLLALAIQTALKHESEWVEVFVAAGRKLLAGEDIYAAGSDYAYPPFMAFLAAPLSFVPEFFARAVWFAASVVSMVVMIRAAWSIAGGPTFASIRNWPRREWIAAGLGLACAITFILNAFAHQQTDIIIGALLMMGCRQLISGRDASGGTLIGLAAACKATPLLWVPYLGLRRRYLAGLLAGGVAVAVNLLPDLIAPPPGGNIWLERWVTHLVLPSQRLNTALGTWGSELIYNQSLGGTLQRLANTRLERQDGMPVVVERPLVAATTLKLGYFALLAGMIVICVWAARRAARAPPSQPPAVVFEFGIVLTLMLLMSPMSSNAHFGILVLPGFCLARHALIHRDRAVAGLVIVAGLLALLCNKDPVGTNAYTALLWSGAITASTLLLWLGCVLALARRPRAAA